MAPSSKITKDETKRKGKFTAFRATPITQEYLRILGNTWGENLSQVINRAIQIAYSVNFPPSIRR